MIRETTVEWYTIYCLFLISLYHLVQFYQSTLHLLIEPLTHEESDDRVQYMDAGAQGQKLSLGGTKFKSIIQ